MISITDFQFRENFVFNLKHFQKMTSEKKVFLFSFNPELPRILFE